MAVCACSYQPVAVAEGHLAAGALLEDVSHVVAVGGVAVAPGQPAPLPVLHAESVREQAGVQREVQQEICAGCCNAVEQLPLHRLGLQTAARPPPPRSAQDLPPWAHPHRDSDLIVIQAGEELS